jgi:hypothetical protein
MKCNATEKGIDEDEECFEGFAYELVAEMAKYNGFKFKFTTNEDYGSQNLKTGKWNGMIGELQSMVSFYVTYTFAIQLQVYAYGTWYEAERSKCIR